MKRGFMSDAVVISLVQYGAWPIVVLLLVLAFECPLRSLLVKHLPSVLQRGGKIQAGPLTVEVNAANAVAQQRDAEKAAPSHSPSEIQLKEMPGLERTPTIARVEQQLHANLKAIPENDRIDLLIRTLAQSRLEAAFGIIYAGIFGSQIAGLIQLEARRRVPTNEAYEFFKTYELKYPEIYKNYGFPGWLQFLKTFGLISQEGEEVLITIAGDDFLRWMRTNNLSADKVW